MRCVVSTDWWAALGAGLIKFSWEIFESLKAGTKKFNENLGSQLVLEELFYTARA